MKRRIDEVAPWRRRSFMQLLGSMIGGACIPAGVRFAAYDQLVGEAKAAGLAAQVPTYFIEVNLRDQWDFMHVFVPPGIVSQGPNLIRGEDGKKCTLFYDPQTEVRQHANNFYTTPDSAALVPYLDSIAICELNEICTGRIHGHEAVNAIRSPGRTMSEEPGKSPMWEHEPGYSEQANEYYYSSTPTPACLHNWYQKQLTPTGLKNGITMKYISRNHTICHYGAGMASAELTRIQSVDQLFQEFPDTVEDLNILPTPQEAELLENVLERVDQNFFARYGYKENARTKHTEHLAEAAGLWHSGETKLVSMPLTEEEIAYWSADVPDQVGDHIKAQIWEQAAWAFKLLSNDVTRTVSIEFDYLDVHGTRNHRVLNTQALQCALPLARLIESLQAAGIYDQTVIAVISADGGRSPEANSYGNSGKNTLLLAGRHVKPGYYGDVGVAGPSDDGHMYNYRVPDPTTGALGPAVTDNSGRLDGAHAWRTIMTALDIPDEVLDEYPDVAGKPPLEFMIDNG